MEWRCIWNRRGSSWLTINIIMIGKNEGIIAPGAQNSPMIVAPHTKNSPISIAQNFEVIQLLETVKNEFRRIEEHLPPEKRAEAAKHLENLDAAAKAKDKVWYSISAKGLLDASRFVKEFAGNILSSITKVGKAIWSDFDL